MDSSNEFLTLYNWAEKILVDLKKSKIASLVLYLLFMSYRQSIPLPQHQRMDLQFYSLPLLPYGRPWVLVTKNQILAFTTF